MQWLTGLMILRGEWLPMTNRQEDICNSIVAFATENMVDFFQAFCGWGGYDISYHLYTFALTWIISDFVEFAYHLLGHSDVK